MNRVINVYVGTELKSRMDEHPEINWSEIAREAFEKTLREFYEYMYLPI